ncbi:hypothetical protein CEXT_519981 [Caerostris extrusa]|uniref:Uncharacterized protein n=1 Tax=Caerostris extrusa TaxID=172846 RepID=A0AAV4XCF8_CAEEX|nr:hypothetical protein CEXT_519981 [Caerostris extrusa]
MLTFQRVAPISKLSTNFSLQQTVNKLGVSKDPRLCNSTMVGQGTLTTGEFQDSPLRLGPTPTLNHIINHGSTLKERFETTTSDELLDPNSSNSLHHWYHLGLMVHG